MHSEESDIFGSSQTRSREGAEMRILPGFADLYSMRALVCICCVFMRLCLFSTFWICVFGSRMETSSSELRILPGFADRRFLTAAAAAACSTPVSVCLLCLVYLCVCVFAGVF